MNQAKEWFINNKNNLKKYEDEYNSIEDENILELEIIRIRFKIKMNLSKRKINASFSVYMIQFITFLLSFGLGVGVFQNILQGINEILSRGLGVLANMITL